MGSFLGLRLEFRAYGGGLGRCDRENDGRSDGCCCGSQAVKASRAIVKITPTPASRKSSKEEYVGYVGMMAFPIVYDAWAGLGCVPW